MRFRFEQRAGVEGGRDRELDGVRRQGLQSVFAPETDAQGGAGVPVRVQHVERLVDVRDVSIRGI